jgi:hypothetical protein
LQATKRHDQDEAPNLKTKDMILWCLVRAITRLRDGDKRIWSNGGVIITTGKTKKKKICKKPVSVPFYPP